MQTLTSLTFFTAISVALAGALAEELMICCRHVRTELYIIIDVTIQPYRVPSTRLTMYIVMLIHKPMMNSEKTYWKGRKQVLKKIGVLNRLK